MFCVGPPRLFGGPTTSTFADCVQSIAIEDLVSITIYASIKDGHPTTTTWIGYVKAGIDIQSKLLKYNLTLITYFGILSYFGG